MITAPAAVAVAVAVAFAMFDTTSATQPSRGSASSLRQRLVAASSAGPLRPEGIPVMTMGPRQVGPVTDLVTAFYDGKVYRGDPRSISSGNHTQIQRGVGMPLVAPDSVTFPSGF